MVGIVVVALVFKQKVAVAPESDGTPTICTQDAKQCPDGSYVGRRGPNCEFVACPTGVPAASVQANPTPTPSATTQNQIITISFINGTATPNVVTIKIGDTVKFVNNDSTLRWPASGVHPTHQICPGFDSLRGLNTGESYSFTFREVKTCPWHDHLKPSIIGRIIVTE